MRTSLSALALAACLAAGGAHAAEGALGRPISGTGVTPNAGIVPPEPIMAVNLGEIYFDGKISGSKSVPVGNQATLGLDAEISFTLATFLKVWDTGPGRWNFSSSVTVPYVWEKASATVTVGGLQGTQKDKTSNLFDITFTPITAGYHISKTEHVAFSFNVWAPTGKYDPSKLANPSLNNWTFIPQVAYTKIWPEEGFTLDAVSGIQFYTPNGATNYHNAPLFTLDVMAMKKFPGRPRRRPHRRHRAADRRRQRPDRRCPERISGSRLGDRPDPHLRHQARRQGAALVLDPLGAHGGSQEPTEEHEHRHGDGNAHFLKGSA